MIGVDTSFLIACEVSAHEHHFAAHQLLKREVQAGERLALCPQLISEFVHVVTDQRRFSAALSIEIALQQADRWSTAVEVKMVNPDGAALEMLFQWMRDHPLGRKRVLDTLMAATYSAHGVTRIATLNPNDFRVFGVFDFISP